MSTASDCSFKSRIRVHSDERVPRGTYSAVQTEVVELLQDLFRQAGMKDCLPSSLPASASVWDSLSCPSKSKIAKIGKPELAEFVERACRLLVERCYPALENLSAEVEEYERKVLRCQEEMITVQRSLAESQDRLVKLQCQLLDRRDAEISAVKSTAETEMKSFATVLQKSCDVALAPKRVQKAIQSASEDRSNNIIIHGMSDDPDECKGDLEDCVRHVMRRLDEDLCGVTGFARLGRFRDGHDRPIMLRLSSSSLRDKLLSRKSRLKGWEYCQGVYLSPDLTLEERETRRGLVAEMKARREAEPGKVFFIKSGKVMEKLESTSE